MSSFNVTENTFEKLFSAGSVAFEIPPFQRRYAWGTDEISELLSDLFAEADSVRNDDRSYFLGSIVVQAGQSPNHPDVVLDGQQRLCTVSLLLAELAHRLRTHEDAKVLQSLLSAGRVFERKHPKIRVQDQDRKAFEALIEDPTKHSHPEFRNHQLAKAIKTIQRELDEILEGVAATDHQDRLMKMAKRVMYDVQLVKISASSESAAFRLFETLNDRGLPLNAADLIKNKLFSVASPTAVAEMQETWKEITEELAELESVQFFRHYWIAFHGSVSKARLFDEVSAHISKLDNTKAAAFAREVLARASTYRRISIPTDEDWRSSVNSVQLVESLRRLEAFRAKACRPALLACAHESPEDLARLAKACETLTVRHTVIGERNPNQLDSAYEKCARRIQEKKDVALAIKETLLPLAPPDDRFADDFKAARVGYVTASHRELLIAFNSAVSTGEALVAAASKVHVEHIFPRNPSQATLRESEIVKEDVDEICGMIGNLTLLLGRKNQSISNRPFSQKRVAFAESELSINRAIATSTSWKKPDIEARTAALATSASRIWPLSDLGN